MKYIENIVVGKPKVSPECIFAFDENDWLTNESEKTIFVEERNLAAILKEIEIVKSISEVKRNKPELCIMLDKLDYIEVKWGKRRLFILVGE